MDQKLVIVESPAKAKTIGKMLGRGYSIKASMGHVRDLPAKSFGVDIEHDFAPQYEETKERAKNLADLKTAAKNASEIYLAPDPDREGEAIAWHLREILSKCNKKAPFHRVTFHEITRSAIAKAFQSPSDVDLNRVDAQQARRVLDRIVGYMVSPLLWGRIEKGLSAGRVQSVALRLVCEREREILAFTPKEYWNFIAEFLGGNKAVFHAKLNKINGKKFEISGKADADALAAAVKGAASWKVTNLETVPRKRNPAPPFITSTLQQSASSILGFSASGTMRIAQKLYEGMDVGTGGPVGLITYMRTDAVSVAVEAQNAARGFIAQNLGKEYVPERPNIYRSKESAQGAHEAIRPTNVELTPEQLRPFLDDRSLKLYTLIWRRFVASQCAPARELHTTLDVAGKGSDSNEYEFRSNASILTFPGFLKVYNMQEEGSPEQQENERDAEALKSLKQGDPCKLKDLLSEQKFTEPPARFSEATLIKELESNGIGRPSTYATIVNTIQDRAYVEKEKGKLIPTELGFRICDFLVMSLPELFQVGFTAEMESKLDSVEEGKVQWTAMMHEFYDKFAEWLKAAKTKDAPESKEVEALLKLFDSLKEWEPPRKSGNRTYDDKKIVNSFMQSVESGKTLSAPQWETLLKIAVKYAKQLSSLKQCAAKYGFEKKLEAAETEYQERIQLREERRLKQEEAAKNAPPQETLQEIFTALAGVTFDEPQRSGKRVYDDKKFFESLKSQNEAGRILSEKQIAALSKLCNHYRSQLPSFDHLSQIFSEIGVQTAAEQTANPGENEEADQLLKRLESVTQWEPARTVRGRVYDDRIFAESLRKQRSSGKVLSPKQMALLRKTAGKYFKN